MKGTFQIEYMIDGRVVGGLYDALTFSGGEEHVSVEIPNSGIEKVEISARVKSSKDLMRLMLIKDAIDNKLIGKHKPRTHLIIPYLPYARQDRVTSDGFSFSLKVAAKMINSMEFDKVTTCDVHSDVALGVVDNIHNHGMGFVAACAIQNTTFANAVSCSRAACRHEAITVIIPDAGASKRCEEFSAAMSQFGVEIELIQATKERDPSTGKINGVTIHCNSLANRNNIIVVDDICDGGRTFVEIAKEAYKKRAFSMDLLVTHGIFSKGMDELSKYYNRIFTSDSWCTLSETSILDAPNVFSVIENMKEAK